MMNTSSNTKLVHVQGQAKGKGTVTDTATTTVKTTVKTKVQRNRAALLKYAENRNEGLIKISAKGRAMCSITGRILPAKGVRIQGVPKTGVNVAVNPELNPGVVPADKPSKGSQSKRKQRTQIAQQSQILREARRERLLKLSEHSRLARSPRLAPRKVSVCPTNRSVASLAMNVPSGKLERESPVVSTGSDDVRVKDRANDRVSVNRASSQPKAQRAKTTVAKTTVATPVIKRSLTPQVDKQSVETHRIAGTDLYVSAICKNLVTDIVSVFGTLGVDKMPVDSLLQHLCADSSKPWSAYQGKPITARQLNRVLTKELGIHSYDIRVGVNVGANGSKTVKGLHRRVFELLQVLLNAGYTPLTLAQHPVDATHT